MPHFIIVGAARAATTSLHYYLTRHPQIAMSRIKEPNFFLFDRGTDPPTPLVAPDARLLAKSVVTPRDYHRLFARPDGGVAGEASPLYLYVRETPALIAAANPATKIIVVVRDPIERARSHFMSVAGASLNGDTVGAFRRAIEPELAEPGYTPYAIGAHYLRLGRYGEQVARYLDCFPPDQLLVLSFDEVAHHTPIALARICDFIGVDPGFDFGALAPHNSSRRRGREPRRLASMLSQVQPRLKGALPPSVVAPLARLRARALSAPAEYTALPDELHRTLADYFRADVEHLRSLTDVDTKNWLAAA